MYWRRQRTKSTATHEAGHAVIACVLGLECAKLTIHPDHNAAGLAAIEAPMKALSRWEGAGASWRGREVAYHAKIIAVQAGAEAVKALIPRKVEQGDEMDRYQVGLLLHDLTGSNFGEAYRLERRLRRFAKALVRRHRKAIRAVAAALYEHGTLSDKQVRELMHT